MTKAKVPSNGATKAPAKVATHGLIVDQPKLMLAITNAHRGQAKLDKQFHLLACASLFMAAEHGQVGPLNALYRGLKPAMQSALKAWVSFTCGDMKFPLGMGEGQGWLRAFDREKSEKQDDGFFRVITDRMPQRKHFAAEIEIMVKGSGKVENGGTGRKYMEKEIKPFTEHRLTSQNLNAFNEMKVLSTLENLRRQVSKDDSNIHPFVRAEIDRVFKAVDSFVEENPALVVGNKAEVPQQIEGQVVH